MFCLFFYNSIMYDHVRTLVWSSCMWKIWTNMFKTDVTWYTSWSHATSNLKGICRHGHHNRWAIEPGNFAASFLYISLPGQCMVCDLKYLTVTVCPWSATPSCGSVHWGLVFPSSFAYRFFSFPGTAKSGGCLSGLSANFKIHNITKSGRAKRSDSLHFWRTLVSVHQALTEAFRAFFSSAVSSFGRVVTTSKATLISLLCSKGKGKWNR